MQEFGDSVQPKLSAFIEVNQTKRASSTSESGCSMFTKGAYVGAVRHCRIKPGVKKTSEII